MLLILSAGCSGTLAPSDTDPGDTQIVPVPDTFVADDAPPPGDAADLGPDTVSLAACWIDGVAFLHADAKPKSGCQYCDEATPGAWTNRPNGLGCDPLGFCIDGACSYGCLIEDTVVADGAADPANPCRVCAPLASRTEFSPTPGTPPCENGVCHAGTCSLPPTIVNLWTTCGSTAGGTQIRMDATGLTADLTLTLDGAPVTGISVVDANTLEGTSPPGSPGPVEAVLKNAIGQAGPPATFHYFIDAAFAYAEVRELNRTPSELATGDFDADGLNDVVYLKPPSYSYNTKDIVIEKGTVAGALGEPVHHESGPVRSLSVGDLDADGADDVVATMGDAYQILKGTPGSDLVPLEIVDLPLLNLAGPGALGRVDDDAHLDLVVGCVGQLCGAVLLGNGDGTFGQPIVFASTTEIIALALGDLNADGLADLVTTSHWYWAPGDLSTWLGNGDGTFNAAGSRPGEGAFRVYTADFDNDGDDDVLVPRSHPHSLARIFRSTTEGNLAEPELVRAGYSVLPADSVLPVDVNGDGHVDVIGADHHDGLYVSLNEGNATFPCGWWLQSDEVGYPAGLAAPRIGSDRPSIVLLTDSPSPGPSRVLFRSVPVQSGPGL